MTGLLSATSCLDVSSKTDHGMVRVVVCVVQVQHVLHSSHELPAHLRDAPLLLLPRLEFVFLSIWRTVSREMLSANPIATTLSASSWIVQSACPSGASLHAMAIRCASCLPSNLRFCPGRGRSLSALSSSSFTNRVRTRPTVDALINRPLAMSRSVMPSSAFSNTQRSLDLTGRSLATTRHLLEMCPFRLVQLHLVLESSHVFVCPPYRIIHKTNLFLILVKYTWNRY